MQNEWKGSERSAKGMVKGLHKAFKAVVNELNNAFTTLVESGSDVSHFITEHRNFAEVSRLPPDTKKDSVESNFERDKHVIKNEAFVM